MPNFVAPDRTEPPRPQNASRDLSRNTLFGNERDPADRLPPIAREKLSRLRRELADARALASQPYERMKELHDKARACDARVDYLLKQRPGVEAIEEHNKIIELEREAATKFRADARSESAEYEARKERVAALGGTVRKVEEYVAAVQSAPLEPALPVETRLGKGETPSTAVERIREKIAKLADEKFDAENAPFHSSIAKQRARAKIEALAERGKPNVMRSLETKQPFSFTMKMGEQIVTRGEGGVVASNLRDQFDAEATFAWLHKDALIAAIDREIDAVADDAHALTDAERRDKLASIAAELLEAERQEEAAIEAASASGVVIPRRGGADPRAVLGLSDDAPAPTND